ncbi:MAG TPA: hypothetical protein VK203_27740 [Nostocaceae cyanobacterium]|nr:hypothetical protein [Nostocaceae cyanobacterium]
MFSSSSSVKQFKLAITCLAIATVFFGSLFSFTPTSEALTYKGSSIWRLSNGNVTISANAADVKVDMGWQIVKRDMTVKKCGIISFPYSRIKGTPSFVVGNARYDVSSLPVRSLPKCVDGALINGGVPIPTAFRTPDDKVVVRGFQSSTVLLQTLKGAVKTVKMNACSFGTLKSTTTLKIPSEIGVFGKWWEVSKLPITERNPTCREGIAKYGGMDGFAN